MHKFGFDAKPLIAWMRICRTGMVVGEQQQFLVKTQIRLSQIMRMAPSANYTAVTRGNSKPNGYYSPSTTPSKYNDDGII
jgi:hypothetical protein